MKEEAKFFRILAAPQGFEPRYAAPEAAVLPLNEGATTAERAPRVQPVVGYLAFGKTVTPNLFIIKAFTARVNPRRLTGARKKPNCSQFNTGLPIPLEPPSRHLHHAPFRASFASTRCSYIKSSTLPI